MTPPIAARLIQQFDLSGVFQSRLTEWDSQISIALDKLHVFKKSSSQQQIVNQHVGKGYMALHQFLVNEYPVHCTCPNIFVYSPPVQLLIETVAQEFQHYMDCFCEPSWKVINGA